jgi:hypothetical protein
MVTGGRGKRRREAMARPKKITQEVTRDLFAEIEQPKEITPPEPKKVPKTKLEIEQEAGRAALRKKR